MDLGPATERDVTWREAALLLGLTAAAGVMRFVVGVQGGDLWLDEAWTVLTARDAAATGQGVLAEPYRVDNNHPLMTWLVVQLGPHRPGWVYRTAVWAATAALPLMAFAGCRGLGRGAAWAGAVYAATAFAVTVYGTEVRGYGFAVAAAVAGLALVAGGTSACGGRTRPWRVGAYWAVALLGLLGHLTYVHAMAGLMAVTAVDRWRQTKSWAATARGVLAWHGVPAAMAVLLYAAFFRDVKVAGGPAGDVAAAMAGAASLAWNGPWAGAAAWGVGVGVAGGTLWLAWRCRAWSGVWAGVWAGVVAWLAAAATVAVKSAVHGQADVVFPRYFLVAAVLSALCATATAWRWAVGGTGSRVKTCWRLAVTGALASVVLAASVVQHLRFVSEGGRGQYRAALAVVASSGEPTLGSDYDSRTMRLENHYRPDLPGRVRYIRAGDWRAAGETDGVGGGSVSGAPAWYLLNSSTTVREPVPQRLEVNGTAYVYVRTFGQYGPSGWRWHLYRREG